MRSDRSPEPTCALRSAARSAAARAFEVVEPRAQHRHGDLAVAVLRFLGTGHHDAGGQMGDAHRAESVVFTCCPPAPLTRIVSMRMSPGGDVDIDGLGLGQDGDGGRRGVDAPARFGFRHTLHPVHAAFVFEAREDALAHDPRRDLLDAAELGLLPVDDLDRQPFASA
jgi:hypothetical protein